MAFFAQGAGPQPFWGVPELEGTFKVVGLKVPFVSTKCPINFGYQKSKTVFRWPTKEEDFILDTSFGLGEVNCELCGPD